MPRKKLPADLPQIPVAWHIVVRSLKTLITFELEDEIASRPTILLITLPEEREILGSEIYPHTPEIRQILDDLVRTMTKPDRSTHLKPHRPQSMIFEQEALLKALGPALKEMEISASCEPALPETDELFEIFEDMLQEQVGEEESEGGELPGILEIQGNTPEQVGHLWAAAADYYRAAPWKYLADGQPLALEFSPLLQPDTLKQAGLNHETEKQGFVQLMGNAGMQFGMILYWNWEDVLNSYEMMERDPLETIPAEGWNTFTFEEADAIPSSDLDAIEEHGWEIAGPEAYPLPVIYFGDRLERPGAEMLAYYEAALRTIPQFVKHLLPDEENDYQALEMPITVESGLGTRIVTVRYPAGELPASIFLDDGEDLDEEFAEEGNFEEEELPDFYFEDEEEEGEEDEDDLFLDRRSFEGELAALSHALDGISGEQGMLSPDLYKAQQIMYRAWEERRPTRRVQLAQKALEVSPDCADAYVLLAEEEAETPAEACEYFEKGMQAGIRALGESYFTNEYEGKFWGLLETRGYMRARAGLAECLEYLDRSNEAIMHYEALLQLNPSDNQGIRYQLMGLLLRQNMNIQAGKLLEDYKDDSTAVWAYTRALLAFRRLGPSIQADAALRRALRVNPHVSPYLNGSKPLPEELPETMGFGDENEAIDYAAEYFGNWWSTPGAVGWLKDIAKGAHGGKAVDGKNKKKRRRS